MDSFPVGGDPSRSGKVYSLPHPPLGASSDAVPSQELFKIPEHSTVRIKAGITSHGILTVSC